jgi:hypothetical protein
MGAVLQLCHIAVSFLSESSCHRLGSNILKASFEKLLSEGSSACL